MSGQRSWGGSGAGRRLVRLLPLLTILAVTVVFFAPTIFQGRVFLAADALSAFYPWKALAPPGFRPQNMLITDPVNGGYAENYNQLLKQGRLVDWNPYLAGGMPACNTASMGVPGRYYPVKLLLHALFPTYTALSLLLLLHLALMGWFMYRYLARMGAGRRGATFGAVAYMLNGCAMVWLSFETVLPVAAFLPLLLLLAERFRGPERFRWAAVGALVFGLVVLMGHTQYLLYVIMMLMFYAVFILAGAWRSGGGLREALLVVASFAVMGIGGMIIGAAEVLPVLEVISVSSRAGRVFTFDGLFETLGRVPWRYFVTLVFPDYFGSPPLGMSLIPRLPFQEYMNYNELCLYLGVPTLFGLLAAAVRPRVAAGRFFLVTTLLLVAMMTGTWAFGPFFAFFPGMNRLNPTRLVFLFAFTATAAAGFGFGNLERLVRSRRRLFVGLAVALVASVALLAVLSERPGLIAWFQSEMVARSGRNPAFMAAVADLRSPGSPVMLKPLLITVAAGALFVAFALVRNRLVRRGAHAAVLGLLVYEMVSFGWGYNPAVRPETIYPETPAITFLKQQPGVFRVVQDGATGLYVNTLLPFRIAEVGGYMNVYPERSSRLLSFVEYGERSLAGARFDRWVMFTNHASPLYDLLNVRYLLTAPGATARSPRYKLVYRNDLAIWENLTALPRASVVHRVVVKRTLDEVLRHLGSPAFDPRREVVLEPEAGVAETPAAAADVVGSSARIDSYDFDEVIVTADAAAPGFLVLADTYYPGWRAYVDGKETPIRPADCSLRAVAIPAGRHTVAFRFRSGPARWGRVVTAAGFLLALGGLGFPLLRRRRARA